MAQINPYAYEGSSDSLATKASGDRPTHARYGVLTMLVLMAVLLYVDRFAVNVATTVIRDELGLSNANMGWISGAFFWAYALAQVPAGWLTDRWGGRLTLTLYVASWSAIFGAIGLANGFWMLILLRGLLGVAQAGAYSTAAGILKAWIPFSNRGFANGAVSMGGRAGNLLANIITVPLMFTAMLVAQQLGSLAQSPNSFWRPVFILYGLLGLIWAAIYWSWFRNRPSDHPGCNLLEEKLILADQPPPAPASSAPPASEGEWLSLFANRNLWLLSSIMFCVNVGWIFLATWLQTYLKEVHGASLLSAGSWTALTGLAGIAGCLSGGLYTDWLVRRSGYVWGRRLPGVISCGGGALAYLSCLVFDLGMNEIWVFATVFFLSDLALGSVWSVCQEVGARYSATMFAFVNMCGNLGAAVFTTAIGYLAEQDQWQSVFIATVAALLIAMTAWLFIDPRIKLPERVAA